MIYNVIFIIIAIAFLITPSIYYWVKYNNRKTLARERSSKVVENFKRRRDKAVAEGNIPAEEDSPVKDTVIAMYNLKGIPKGYINDLEAFLQSNNGFTKSGIKRCIRRKIKSHNEYIFRKIPTEHIGLRIPPYIDKRLYARYSYLVKAVNGTPKGIYEDYKEAGRALGIKDVDLQVIAEHINYTTLKLDNVVPTIPIRPTAYGLIWNIQSPKKY